MNAGRIANDRGLIGKVMVIWIVVLALVGVAAIDTFSIVRAHLSLANAATDAAHEAANNYEDNGNVAQACAAAAQFAARADRGYRVARRGGCVVEAASGEVTLTLRTRASTILVGRIGPVSGFVRIAETATAGRSSL